eukprot:PhF_6_TR44489/c2_g1_i1/m.68510
MLSLGTWHCKVRDVVNIFKDRALLNHVPMRLESIEDDDADFSFFHKSMGEYLCAYAFWNVKDAERYIRLSSQHGVSFSKHEQGVLSFFNECAMSDIKRRDLVCGETMMKLVRSANAAREVGVVSNTLALLCISQCPLQHVDLSGLVVKDALLYEALFEKTHLEQTHFIGCDMNRATFHECSC